MAIFSPISERSWKVRSLYITIYAILILGAVTMVAPFMIMITGSVEPRSQIRQGDVFPAYLFDEDGMWQRYLESKYHGVPDTFRMAWGTPGRHYREETLDVAQDSKMLELWNEFMQGREVNPILYSIGFLRNTTRMPSYYGHQFQRTLLRQHGNSVEGINGALGTQFRDLRSVTTPVLGIVSAPVSFTPVVKAFFAFSQTVPWDRNFVWDVGGYYRGVYLPRVVGTVEAYNSKYGTNYSSFTEVPFTELAPEVGTADWLFYVTRVLRPDFVVLTESGEVARQASGLNRDEFLRTQAKAADIRIHSLDRQFAAFAAERGIEDARIPQATIDYLAFQQEKGFWKWQFLTMNYVRVLDEILLHGRAITNTLILVVLSVAGALIVNPLAAYALSRFKLKTTYHILLFCLATIAFPAEVTMIPVFLQLKEFNLLNTFGALVLPGLANGFSIFLLKGFFDSLPKELFEAAELDGASELNMFWQITMNLSKPILAVIALGAFTGAYGAFFFALILAPDPSMWTIMVYIYQLRLSVDPPVVYASLIITALPTLLVFIFCQNIILRGIVVPSDK